MGPGDILDGRFELEKLAASGGMGEVFRALDRASNHYVAVKVLLREHIPERLRFEREGAMLAELRHPGVVRYVAHGIASSGEPYIAMEWLEGEDLRSRLARAGLTTGESITLLGQAAAALGSAHSLGIVHRDLKPANLFLEGNDVARVKLLDFGIAKFGGVTRMTRTGVIVGTPGYMAPEQVRGEQPAGARADVFALGCVLFECLTGKPAFMGDHLMAILAKILIADSPRVRELRPEIPADLDALVARMLAKRPEDRPGDGTAVVEALAALGTPAALLDAPPTSEHAPVLTLRERRALSVILIGGVDESQDVTEAATLVAAPSNDGLRRAVAACGGEIDLLAGGMAVVMLGGRGFATDQAARTARCALSLLPHTGGRAMALATGPKQVTARVPLGDAIDRATEMLSRSAPPDSSRRAESRTSERLSRPRLIAIDEVTAGLLDARFDIRESDAGLWLRGERAIAEGSRTLLGKHTACVGRDRELRMLDDLFAECAMESEARSVMVIAPVGMGKSRLVYEFTRNLKQLDEAPTIWIGRGDPLRMGSAFGLLGQALRGACGILDGEPLDVRREKLIARVARHVSPDQRLRVAEFLGDVIGTPLPDEGSVALREARKDAQLMGDQMRIVWEEFLRAECSAGPVVLLLEDMHWGDLPTLRFVDEALISLRDKPWMMLGLARPDVYDVFPRLRERAGMHEIRLTELTRKASERLVRQVLGDSVNPSTVKRLVERADGNAFYLEELIRATAERGAEALPETVVAMVQSRLDALDGAARRVLRAASVFGEVLWPGGVASLLGSVDQASKVAAQLSALVDREVLVRRRESRFPGEEELAFRHALLREGAYAMLTEADCVLGHRLAGEWLLQHGESDHVVLAEHFEQGGEPERAAEFRLRAAEQALNGDDTEGAITQAGRGLAGGVSGDLRVNLLATLCEAHLWRSEWSVAAPYAEEVMQIAKLGSLPWTQALQAKLMDRMYRGSKTEFLETVSALDMVTLASAAAVPSAMALHYGVFYLTARGEVASAEAFLRKMHSIIDPIADERPFASAILLVGDASLNMYAKDEIWLARERALQAKARMVETSSRRGNAIARVFVGMSLWILGANEEAERELSSITAQDSEIGPVSAVRRFCVAGVLLRRNALDESHAAAIELIELGRSTGLPSQEGRGRWALADVLYRKGDFDAAEREVLAALEILTKLPVEHIAATATLAAVRLAKGRAAEALADAEDAMTRYTVMRACGWFRGQLLRVVHAQCLHAIGHRRGAQDAIAEARGRLLLNGAKITDSAYRKSFFEGIPENVRTLELAEQWLGEADIAL